MWSSETTTKNEAKLKSLMSKKKKLSIMSDYFKCDWCGHSFEKSGGAKVLGGFTGGISNLGKKYCSKSCEYSAKEAKDGPKNSSNNEPQFPAGANQSSGGTTVVNKGDGFLTTGVKTLGGLYGQMLDDTAEREEKARLDGKIDSVTSVTFNSNADDIANQLNQLVSLGCTKPDKALKNAIIEKIEFGIMKLRGLNANAEADFFQNKLEPLKKKGWF